MGRLIVHAGMPKAGSSSIQSWLAEGASGLRDQFGIEIAVARKHALPGEKQAALRFTTFGSQERRPGPRDTPEWIADNPERAALRVSSGPFLRAYTNERAQRIPRDTSVLDLFVEQLDAISQQHPLTVVSCEGFGSLLSQAGADAAFLAALDELGQRHEVRLAYYVRPQHTTLEASWRQWGFRTKARPSAWLTRKSQELHYLQTKSTVNAVAPHVSFEIRPFRTDLLYHESPVADFAHNFLGIDELGSGFEARRANIGLPLELVIALRDAPEELIGRDPHDNKAFTRLQHVFADTRIEPDDRILRSRVVLQAYCHERFESENAALFATLGWPATEFVPSVESKRWDLCELDDLWRPAASPAERALLFRALIAAIS